MPLPTAARRFGLVIAFGYAAGMLPTADLVARKTGDGSTDLHHAGSGNPGGVNALKVLGARAGATVLAVDIAKGAVACAVGRVVAGPAGAHLGGTAAVVGHCYPAINRFQGGKGVAASVGQCLATFPVYFPIDAAVAGVTAANPAAKRRAFDATLVSSAAWTIGGLVWWRKGWPNLWGPRPSVALPVANFVSSAIIIKRFLDAR